MEPDSNRPISLQARSSPLCLSTVFILSLLLYRYLPLLSPVLPLLRSLLIYITVFIAGGLINRHWFIPALVV